MYSGIRTVNLYVIMHIYIYVFHTRKVYAQETVLYYIYINIAQEEIVSCVVEK